VAAKKKKRNVKSEKKGKATLKRNGTGKKKLNR
jgi:hypothetical protein